MKTIICYFNLFDMSQKILILNEDKEELIAMATLDSLGESIADVCKVYNINKVHLYGNEEYASSLIDEIDTHTGAAYSNNLIEIEVN